MEDDLFEEDFLIQTLLSASELLSALRRSAPKFRLDQEVAATSLTTVSVVDGTGGVVVWADVASNASKLAKVLDTLWQISSLGDASSNYIAECGAAEVSQFAAVLVFLSLVRCRAPMDLVALRVCFLLLSFVHTQSGPHHP